MKIDDFKLERYFAKHEFTAEYLLSCSDCDGYSLDEVLESASPAELNMWQKMTFGYTESAGSTVLREAILPFYKISSIDNIVVASPGELNFITMNLLLGPEDHCICISPCYQSLSEIVQSIGSEISFWKPSTESWHFDTGKLESLIRSNTKLIIINFPHNPTGAYLTQEEMRAIVEVARRHDLYIFSDEMYHKLIIGEVDELEPMSDVYEKGISLWGTSKTFGLAGLRTGWLVSQDEGFIKKVISFKDYLSICSSTPSEVLSIIALNHIDDFLQPNILKIRKNILLFKEFALKHDVFQSFIPPRAGSTSFIGLNLNSTSKQFSEMLVDQSGIMTVPGEMFGMKGNYIRIGFGRKNLSQVLDKLDQYLLELNKSL